jgi:hypothetical protein
MYVMQNNEPRLLTYTHISAVVSWLRLTIRAPSTVALKSWEYEMPYDKKFEGNKEEERNTDKIDNIGFVYHIHMYLAHINWIISYYLCTERMTFFGLICWQQKTAPKITWLHEICNRVQCPTTLPFPLMKRLLDKFGSEESPRPYHNVKTHLALCPMLSEGCLWDRSSPWFPSLTLLSVNACSTIPSVRDRNRYSLEDTQHQSQRACRIWAGK